LWAGVFQKKILFVPLLPDADGPLFFFFPPFALLQGGPVSFFSFHGASPRRILLYENSLYAFGVATPPLFFSSCNVPANFLFSPQGQEIALFFSFFPRAPTSPDTPPFFFSGFDPGRAGFSHCGLFLFSLSEGGKTAPRFFRRFFVPLFFCGPGETDTHSHFFFWPASTFPYLRELFCPLFFFNGGGGTRFRCFFSPFPPPSIGKALSQVLRGD